MKVFRKISQGQSSQAQGQPTLVLTSIGKVCIHVMHKYMYIYIDI
jgi:hypothetical protein